MRILMHIDMNSFFASVEQQANPFLRGKPVGITGKRTERSIVAAASIEAKRHGVKTAMPIHKAQRLCPDLILVPGDSKKYRDISDRFNAIFKRYTSLVEPFSIDESTLDVTDCAQDYLGAIAIAQAIKQELKTECGKHITASIGIAPNKLIAKLASESQKPDGLVSVPPERVHAFLDQSPLQAICGIGRNMKKHLDALGINSVQQLREYPKEALVSQFKSYGTWLHNAVTGKTTNHVSITESPAKSIGHAYTLSRDTVNPQVVRRYLLGLSDRVAFRLRKQGMQAQTIFVRLRFGDFTSAGKQYRFAEPIIDGLAIFKLAWQLTQKLWHGDQPIRLIGVTVSNLSAEHTQSSLFIHNQKMRTVLKSLDRLSERYGSKTWQRASTIPTQFLERSSGFRA